MPIPVLLAAGLLLAAPVRGEEVARGAQGKAAPDAPVEAPLHYEIEATLDAASRRLLGRTRVTLRNVAARPLSTLFIFTYPNHYSELDPNVTDELFDRVYPHGASLGEMFIAEVRADLRAVPFRFVHRRDLPPRTLLAVDLPEPLSPGKSVSVEVGYRLEIPRRYGSFGEFSGDICLNGGWHPYLPALDQDGEWRVHDPPPRASFDVTLRLPGGGNVILNGNHSTLLAGAGDTLKAEAEGSFLTLLVSPEIAVYRHSCPGEEITYYRNSRDATSAAKLFETLHDAIAFLPTLGVDLPRTEIRLAEAHLRRDLVLPGEEVTLISDRFLDVVFLGKKYHLGPVVEAALAQSFRGVLAGGETSADLPWVSEAAAWVCAEPFYDEVLEGPNTVKGILAPFSIFVSIDRLLNAPRFPFVRAFYGGFYGRDPLKEDVSRFNNEAPHGRVVAEKMRDLLGSAALLEIVGAAVAGKGAMRRLAEDRRGEDLGWFFEQWRRPYPRMNYRIVGTEQTLGEDGRYAGSVRIRREGGQVREPVGVEVKSFWGRSWKGEWDGEGEEGVAEIVTDRRIWSTRIDPEKRLLETTRKDNQWPPSVKFLVNRFRVRIDLTGRDHEAAVGGTFILGNDYRNKYLITLFSSQEQDGVAAGYGHSFGRTIDPTQFGQSAGVGVSYTELDPEFAARSSGRLNDSGNVTAFNAGYRITTFQTSRNPHSGLSLGLGGEYGDKLFGSDFRFWRGSVSGEAVTPILRDRHLLALKGVAGVTKRDGTPTQRLFDVGGFEAVRGVRTGHFLGHYLWYGKAEYRFILLDHLDVHVMTLGWLRRLQVAVYLEGGNVADRSRRLFQREDIVVGAGVGLRFHIDLFGVKPSVWRIDVAQRLDDRDDDDLLFYIGAGQSF